MKEQVITPRAGRSNSSSGGGSSAAKGRSNEIVQRPARRERGSQPGARAGSKSGGLRKAVVYLPLAGKITLAIVVGILLFAGYRAAASASFFQARNIDISGVSHEKADKLGEIVRRVTAQTGVWRADLDAISRELKSVSWVREAVVSRVLPDGLRVRVTEREPRAVVRTAAGKFLLVDDEGVALKETSATDQISLRGWDEEATEAARTENRARIEKFLEMTHDWEARGINNRVSEVNLNDLRDARVQLTGVDSQIEIQLGHEDFGNRLKFALDELDRQRNTPIGPYILHINVAQGIEKGNHVTIGVSPDAPTLSSATGGETTGPEVESAKVSARGNAVKPASEPRKAKETVARKDEGKERAPKREPDKKEKEKKDKNDKASREAKTESRPRRVG